eukprot:tig00001206_g7489.t1
MNPAAAAATLSNELLAPILVRAGDAPAQCKCSRACPQRRPSTAKTVMKADAGAIAGGIIAVGGVAASIGALAWIERMGARSSKRPNAQSCVVCKGSGKITCRNCVGTGKLPIEVDGKFPSCPNCEGKGTLLCTNCSGNGIQPRYLDRREFVDDD